MKKMQMISDKTLISNVFGLIPVGIFWKDKNRKFIGANKMFLEYYNLKSIDDIIGKTEDTLGWHIDPEPFKKAEKKIIKDGEPITDMVEECIVNGSLKKIKVSKFPLIEDDKIIGLIGYFVDITEQTAQIKKLSNLSITDELTGFLNRRAFNNVVAQYEQQYKKDKKDFVLYRMDLDEFKIFNDNFGHEYGDVVLSDICRNITHEIGKNGVAFRFNGDEFVILHQFTSLDEVETFRRKLVNAVESPRNIEGIKPNLKVSIGYAIYSETLFVDSLLNIADKKMYEHKNSKKFTNK